MHASKAHALPLVLALLICGAAFPAHADSSSVVSTSSTSIGSSSVSIEKSSDSISGKERVAQGQYTVLEVAALPQRPDMLRIHLQAVTGSDDLFLLLPRQAAERGALAPGQVIAAQHRTYGLAFSTLAPGGNVGPFFLVLDDHWYRELESRPVAS